MPERERERERERADSERALLDRAISEGGHELLDAVLAIIRRTGALATTAERAREEAREALAQLTGLPESPYRDALAALAQYSHERTA